MSTSHANRLAEIVGTANCLTEQADLSSFTTDYRKLYTGRALAVVRPGSTTEVSAVMKYCFEQGVAVVPQGGNTSLQGGAVPTDSVPDQDCIVLNLVRLNKVISVDPVNDTMVVQAGVTLAAAREAAEDAGRLFPLRIGSEGSCQIGGNLSTNAGGVQVLHYGNARQLVLGLEVVTPQGEIWNGLRALKKDNTGYDLRDLYLGAEGTLGIITRAVLKLWPKPKDVATAWVAVPSPEAAVALLSGAHAASEDNVTSCELMGRQGIDLVLQHIPGATDPLAERHDWYVLLEWSSTRARRDGENQGGLREKMEAYLGEAMEQGLVLDATIAQNETQARALWALRENHTEASKKEGPSVKHDISVAVSRIPSFVTDGLAAMRKALPEGRPVTFGHVGDGNLHFNCQAPVGWDKARFTPHARTVTAAIYDLVVSYGGSISAEHGIGLLKVDELAHYRSQVEIDTMRTIKRALDPQNLMNPGKIVRV